MYYRVAIKPDESPHWHWESRMIATIDALLRVLRLYRTMPGDSVHVFCSSTAAGLDLMLARANEGLAYNALTVDQLVGGGWSMNHWEIKQLEVEMRSCESEERGVSHLIESSLYGKHIGTSLDERLNSLDMRRLVLELSTPGDHDAPYHFSLPTTLSQTLVWVKLLARVYYGELQP
jgi:hypothetical protein